MPDFRQLVRDCLRDSSLSPEREAEIVEELADHLQDGFHTLVSSGSREQEAVSAITADLKQRNLAHELRRAEQKWTEPIPLGSRTNSAFCRAAAETLLYGLKPHDPFVLTGACAMLAAVAIAASLLPATRAARLQAMTALREE